MLSFGTRKLTIRSGQFDFRCLFICVFLFIYLLFYVCLLWLLFILLFMFVCVCFCMFVCICLLFMFVCVCLFLYVCLCMFVCVCCSTSTYTQGQSRHPSTFAHFLSTSSNGRRCPLCSTGCRGGLAGTRGCRGGLAQRAGGLGARRTGTKNAHILHAKLWRIYTWNIVFLSLLAGPERIDILGARGQ